MTRGKNVQTGKAGKATAGGNRSKPKTPAAKGRKRQVGATSSGPRKAAHACRPAADTQHGATGRADTGAGTPAVPSPRKARGSIESETGNKDGYFITGPLGQALADTNARLRPQLKSNLAWVPRSQHGQLDAMFASARRGGIAHYGEAIAGARAPIVWPDWEKTPHSAMYREPPRMTEETKAVLRERAKSKPRSVGDYTAQLLAGCAGLAEVYALGAKHFGATVRELHTKYDHLNVGQQRMVIGNRLRALMKKAGKQ